MRGDNTHIIGFQEIRREHNSDKDQLVFLKDYLRTEYPYSVYQRTTDDTWQNGKMEEGAPCSCAHHPHSNIIAGLALFSTFPIVAHKVRFLSLDRSKDPDTNQRYDVQIAIVVLSNQCS
jgi:hypothetical protein